MSDAFSQMYELKAESQIYGNLSPERFSPDKPQEKKISERALRFDPKFINYAKQIYAVMQGQTFDGTDDDAHRYGVNIIADFNYNFAQPFAGEVAGAEIRPGAVSQAARLISNGSKDNAKAFVYLMDQYERLPDFTFSGSWRMARGMFTDPSTWGAAATFGAGLAARVAGQKAVQSGLRELAKSMATKKAASVAGATYTGVPAGAVAAVEEQAGFALPPEQRAAEIAAETAIGAVAGPLLVGASELAPKAVKAVRDVLEMDVMPQQTIGLEGGIE
jgi:hypothetical protein